MTYGYTSRDREISTVIGFGEGNLKGNTGKCRKAFVKTWKILDERKQ